jgi:hypothetical protein
MAICTIAYFASVIYRKTHAKSSREEDKYENSEQIQTARIPRLTKGVLLGIGIMDIIGGLLHTFLILFATSIFAGYDFSDPAIYDLLQITVAFGISNFTTSMLAITLALAESKWADKVLLGIPLIYFVGFVIMSLKVIQAESQIYGKYMMLIYFVVCIATFIYTRLIYARNKKL